MNYLILKLEPFNGLHTWAKATLRFSKSIACAEFPLNMFLTYFLHLNSYLITLLLNTICRAQLLCPFYPTALKGCRGIVFTHGVRMGGWAGGGK